MNNRQIDPSLNFANWLKIDEKLYSDDKNNLISDQIDDMQVCELETHISQQSEFLKQYQYLIRQRAYSSLFQQTKLNNGFGFNPDVNLKPILTSNDHYEIITQLKLKQNIMRYSIYQSTSDLKQRLKNILQFKTITAKNRLQFYIDTLQTKNLPKFHRQTLKNVFSNFSTQMARNLGQFQIFESKVEFQLNELFNTHQIEFQLLKNKNQTLPSSGIIPFEGMQFIVGLLQYLPGQQIEIFIQMYQKFFFKLFQIDFLVQLFGSIEFITQQLQLQNQYNITQITAMYVFNIFSILSPVEGFYCLDSILLSDFTTFIDIVCSLVIEKLITYKQSSNINFELKVCLQRIFQFIIK